MTSNCDFLQYIVRLNRWATSVIISNQFSNIRYQLITLSRHSSPLNKANKTRRKRGWVPFMYVVAKFTSAWYQASTCPSVAFLPTAIDVHMTWTARQRIKHNPDTSIRTRTVVITLPRSMEVPYQCTRHRHWADVDKCTETTKNKYRVFQKDLSDLNLVYFTY